MKPAQDSKVGRQASNVKSSGVVQRPVRQRQAGQQQPSQRSVPQGERDRVIFVPLVGVLAFLFAVGLLGWWMLNSGATSTPTVPTNSPQSGLEAQAVTAPIGQDGRQTLDLVVNGDTISYEPKVIKVKQGIPVHFNLSTKGVDPG